MAQIALERPARPPLKCIEPPPELRGLRLGHYGSGRRVRSSVNRRRRPNPPSLTLQQTGTVGGGRCLNDCTRGQREVPDDPAIDESWAQERFSWP